MSNDYQAPAVQNGRYDIISANFIKFSWDTVGEGFLYEIERGIVYFAELEAGLFSEEEYTVIWNGVVRYTSDPSIHHFFDDNLQANTEYQYRVRARGRNADPSEWYSFDLVQTYEFNQNSIITQDSFTLSNKLVSDNFNSITNYINFNLNGNPVEQIGYLMKRDYTFDPFTHNNISALQNSILSVPKFESNLGTVKTVCSLSNSRNIPAKIGDNIYSFERWQPRAEVSPDDGVTWYSYSPFPNRLGNPVTNRVVQEFINNTFVLGYNNIYRGAGSSDVDFSNIEQENGFHSVDLAFNFVEEVTTGLPFKALEFATYSKLAPEHDGRVESFAVTDSKAIVIVTAADGTIRFLDDANATLDPGDGLRLFSDTVIDIRDEMAGMDTWNGNPCIKDMVWFDDPNTVDQGADHVQIQRGRFYFLYNGDWIVDRQFDSPRFTENIGLTQFDNDGNPNPYLGVYCLNYFIDFDGVDNEGNFTGPEFKRDPNTANAITRIYGNTEYERERISLFTGLSRDNDHIVFDILNDSISTEVDSYHKQFITNPYQPDSTQDHRPNLVGPDTNYVNAAKLIENNDLVDLGVKYFLRPYYTSSLKLNQQILGIRYNPDPDLGDWPIINKPADYYDSPSMVWMASDGHRDLKSHKDQHIVVYKAGIKTVPIVTNDNRIEEKYTVTASNAVISDFRGYASGVLICDDVGKVIGFYKFRTALTRHASIDWYPINTMLTATLLNQVRVEPPTVEDNKAFNDPDLLNVFNSMGADEYFEDNMFGEFTKYYIEFLSKGTGTAYNNLVNLMRMHDPLNDLSNEYLYSAFYLRNTLPASIDKEKLMKFFSARDTDFYSSKGVEDSYKFLFKLLYNENIEIETESLDTFVYGINVTTDYVDDSIIGNSINTATGIGSVTTYSAFKEAGVQRYRLVLGSVSGKFIPGQTITIDGYNHIYPEMMVYTELSGIFAQDAGIEAARRGNSYYTMKIRSELQYRQYAEDVTRFIHPVGFPFLGITLITMLINRGISISNLETSIEKVMTLRQDSGLGNNLPPEVSRLDVNGDRQYNTEGLITDPNPLLSEASGLGQPHDEFILRKQYPGAGNYASAIALYDADNPELLFNLKASERRKPFTPIYSTSSYSLSNFYYGEVDGNGEYLDSDKYILISDEIEEDNAYGTRLAQNRIGKE